MFTLKINPSIDSIVNFFYNQTNLFLHKIQVKILKSIGMMSEVKNIIFHNNYVRINKAQVNDV